MGMGHKIVAVLTKQKMGARLASRVFSDPATGKIPKYGIPKKFPECTSGEGIPGTGDGDRRDSSLSFFALFIFKTCLCNYTIF